MNLNQLHQSSLVAQGEKNCPNAAEVSARVVLHCELIMENNTAWKGISFPIFLSFQFVFHQKLSCFNIFISSSTEPAQV